MACSSTVLPMSVASARAPWIPTLRRGLSVATAIMIGALSTAPAGGEPWAEDPATTPPVALQADPNEARALERQRRTVDDSLSTAEQRRRYLSAAHGLLTRFWNSQPAPRLLLEGERAEGCGRPVVKHPMAFYCPESREIALAMNLRRSVRTARGRSDRELLLLELAVLAHEWGHHINRSQGLGPYRAGGLQLTVRQEELAADWRTGVFLGWLLRHDAISVDDYTQTANLLFELGDYERIAPQHHGYPRDRFTALTRGLASQLRSGESLGDWVVDTPETFSRRLLQQERGSDASKVSGAGRRLDDVQLYDVRRFEIDRSNQIATNLVGGLLGAASCAWGSRESCLGMALQQGKGRADGRYTLRQLRLDCRSGRFDISDDPFDPQPVGRDGKGQAAVLMRRDCPTGLSAADS